MRYKVFNDPFYHSDNDVEFDSNDVILIEQKTLTLFLRGKYKVTYITLRSGAEHALQGDVAAEIEAAQAQSQRESNA